MNTKRVHMPKCTPLPGSDARGYARRRSRRRRIWELLHEICLKLEALQPTEEARLACREVAQVLSEVRLREGGRGSSKKD